MPDRTIYTREAALAGGATLQADLALSKLRFFVAPLIPDVTTDKAALVAAETTLVGYPAGGYALTAWSGPDMSNAGGAYITSPMVNVVYASGAAQAMGGCWVEDAGGAVRAVYIFDPVRVVAAVGDGFPIARQMFFGQNFI